MKEHKTVVLTRDHPDAHLRRGDLGAVVHVYEGGAAYEVEFASPTGWPVAVVTLRRDEIRPADARDVLHVRRRAA